MQITGCPWYNILNNPNYAEAFAYVAPHVQDRDFYIEDCDDNDENNGEQSDTVLILLNLGSIPDEVARQFQMKQNFSKQFKKIMETYKKRFTREYGVDWEFSSPAKIKRYS